MSRISRAEVERIAHLARLALSDAELEDARLRLDAILDYAAQLEAVDTADVPPTAFVIPFPTPTRDDVPGALLAPEVAVANAPAPRGTAFTVPRVLEGEDEG